MFSHGSHITRLWNLSLNHKRKRKLGFDTKNSRTTQKYANSYQILNPRTIHEVFPTITHAIHTSIIQGTQKGCLATYFFVNTRWIAILHCKNPSQSSLALGIPSESLWITLWIENSFKKTFIIVLNEILLSHPPLLLAWVKKWLKLTFEIILKLNRWSSFIMAHRTIIFSQFEIDHDIWQAGPPKVWHGIPNSPLTSPQSATPPSAFPGPPWTRCIVSWCHSP